MPGPQPLEPFDSTWSSAIREWCDYLIAGGLSPHTLALRQKQIGELSRDTSVPFNALSSNDVTRWAAGKKWAPNTRRSFRSTLLLFWTFTHRDDLLGALPRVKVPHHQLEPCPDDVYFDAMSRADQRTRLILRLAREAGLRREEVAHIKSRSLYQVPVTGWTLHVIGKGDKYRQVPATDALCGEIVHQRESGGVWLFPGVNGHLSASWVADLASVVLPSPWTLHSLRRAFATAAYFNGGRDLIAVSQLLGHSSVATTMQYIGVTVAHLRDVVESAAPQAARLE